MHAGPVLCVNTAAHLNTATSQPQTFDTILTSGSREVQLSIIMNWKGGPQGRALGFCEALMNPSTVSSRNPALFLFPFCNTNVRTPLLHIGENNMYHMQDSFVSMFTYELLVKFK